MKHKTISGIGTGQDSLAKTIDGKINKNYKLNWIALILCICLFWVPYYF